MQVWLNPESPTVVGSKGLIAWPAKLMWTDPPRYKVLLMERVLIQTLYLLIKDGYEVIVSFRVERGSFVAGRGNCNVQQG